MIFSFFYTLFLHLYLFCKLVQWKKYRKVIGARLAINFPKIEKGARKLIWIHAVSLGETRAVAPLIERLKKRPDPPLIVLSAATRTGHEERIEGADWQVYLPLDLPYIITRVVKRVRPDTVLITETDFWFHFQRAAKEVGAKLVLINGKMSERSYARYERFPFLARYLLTPFDRLLVQNEHYARRFQELGLSNISVTGNLKLDAAPGGNLTREQLGLKDEIVLTIGSTHDPEEKIWLEVLDLLFERFSHLKVILVPRHPERFDQVAALARCGRWSLGDNFKKHRLLLMDRMGMLTSCYAVSDLAFVGGSLVSGIGGHNIIEPIFFKTPVLFGPHMESQSELVELAKSFSAGIEVERGELSRVVGELIEHPQKRAELRECGEKLLLQSGGAVEKTFALL